QVHRVRLHGRVVAVKKLKPGEVTEEENLLREAETTRFLSHENIVRTIGVCSYKPYILADFGLTRCLDTIAYYRANKQGFPYKWTAPEAWVIFDNDGILRQPGRSTSASDVWTFAVVLWELYSSGDVGL
ncbi:hypothetical protein PENTCL1PPCAC_9143, partial [Pristionchus entomophagus]